jgi:hypothetical protein
MISSNINAVEVGGTLDISNKLSKLRMSKLDLTKWVNPIRLEMTQR